MPLYEYRCKKGHAHDEIHKWPPPKEVKCDQCRCKASYVVSLPAKTVTLWNSGWNSGLEGSGFYSVSAGQHVTNKREEESIMRSRGYINEKDLGGENFYNDYMTKKTNERDALDATAKTYRDNLKRFDGDKVRAVSETFPAHEMLKQAAEHDAKTGE